MVLRSGSCTLASCLRHQLVGQACNPVADVVNGNKHTAPGAVPIPRPPPNKVRMRSILNVRACGCWWLVVGKWCIIEVAVFREFEYYYWRRASSFKSDRRKSRWRVGDADGWRFGCKVEVGCRR